MLRTSKWSKRFETAGMKNNQTKPLYTAYCVQEEFPYCKLEDNVTINTKTNLKFVHDGFSPSQVLFSSFQMLWWTLLADLVVQWRVNSSERWTRTKLANGSKLGNISWKQIRLDLFKGLVPLWWEKVLLFAYPQAIVKVWSSYCSSFQITCNAACIVTVCTGCLTCSYEKKWMVKLAMTNSSMITKFFQKVFFIYEVQ